MSRWLTAHEVLNELRISRPTLKVWKDSGKISYKKLSSKKYLYDVNSVYFPETVKEYRQNVIYARVSTSRQTDDLNHQVCILKEYALKNGVKVDEIITDIGSGMNADRRGFNQLLSMIFKNKVDTVYISFKDRLIRFGFDYIKNICEMFNTKIEILDNDEFRNKDNEKELTEDLIAIIHQYSMKVYDNRRKIFNKIKNELQ